MKKINKRIHCRDGVSLSVQASQFAYCSPRDDEGPYTQLEVGFIEKHGERFNPPESWKEFAKMGDIRFSDVFAYVPSQNINDFIAAHGGINVMYL